MQHVFIVGSKGIPGAYGGYETFVDKLTEYHQNHPQLRYHVACKDTQKKEEIYHNARCFHLKVPNIGPAQAILYDVAALSACCKYIKANNIQHPIVYILACRIGPFVKHFVKKLHKLGGVVYVNPDGHEWLRAKWPRPVRKYWKISERMMTRHADLMVCDSKNIENYIHSAYADFAPRSTYIAYGAETRRSHLADNAEVLTQWYEKHGLAPKEYYLVVGRFVPENNFETMIREFMKSKTKKKFALITNVSKSFLNELEEKTGFRRDPRIRFVGTVYDQELLMKIRENAYGYFHGHEVGGTNPSLLEALSSTDLNLLLDVGFNREVACCAALYWSKKAGKLAKLIETADKLSPEEIAQLGVKAKARIADAYSWQFIADEYEKLFLHRQPRE